MNVIGWLVLGAVVAAVAFALYQCLRDGDHRLKRCLSVLPSTGETQAIQHAPDRYVGRATVPDLEALWALPAYDPRLDPVDADAADAINTLDLHPHTTEETS